MSRFTIERHMGRPLAELRRQREREEIRGIASEALDTALERCEEDHRDELLSVVLTDAAGRLAQRATHLTAATKLAAVQGKHSRNITVPNKRARADALFRKGDV